MNYNCGPQNSCTNALLNPNIGTLLLQEVTLMKTDKTIFAAVTANTGKSDIRHPTFLQATDQDHGYNLLRQTIVMIPEMLNNLSFYLSSSFQIKGAFKLNFGRIDISTKDILYTDGCPECRRTFLQVKISKITL